MYPFTYLRPASLDEAVAALRANPEARPLSGGMTLVPTLKQRLARASHLVDLTRLDELQGIALDQGARTLRIGAATRHAAVARSTVVRQAVPALAHLAGLIGDAQVRSRGTMGGSIANNDPGADYPAAVRGLGATIVTDRRRIPGDEFFTGLFSTLLDPGELVVALEWPIPARAVYLKHRHPASGYAVVGVFVADAADGPRVAIGGAGPCAFRWREAEDRLARVPAAQWCEELVQGLRLSPHGLNDDLGATAAYRAHLAGILLGRALTAIAAVH